MSERILQIAREVERDAAHLKSHPQLGALGAARASMSALQREILEEVASSMGRSVRLLEASLARLSALEVELRASSDDERSALVSRFNDERTEARRRLHYLCIQREALGFYRHEELDKYYPVPPKKDLLERKHAELERKHPESRATSG